MVVICGCGSFQLPVAPRNSQCPPSARFLRCNAAICRHGHPESKPGNCLGYPGIKTWWGCLKVRCQFDGWSMLIIDFPWLIWFPYLICHSGISPRWPMLTIWFVSLFGGMTYRTAVRLSLSLAVASSLPILDKMVVSKAPSRDGRKWRPRIETTKQLIVTQLLLFHVGSQFISPFSWFNFDFWIFVVETCSLFCL
jgi:hypothetical protein